MMETELMICQLRRQECNIQSLISYLETRAVVNRDDYSYSRERLRELIESLRKLERFSFQRGTICSLRSVWMN